MRKLWLATTLLLVATACGDAPSTAPGDGESSSEALIRVHPRRTGEGMDAIVSGVVDVDSDAGCVWLAESAGTRYPVVWPVGTTAQSDPFQVTLPDGQVILSGDRVEGGGGYVDAAATTRGLGLDPFPAECIHVGDAAVFNSNAALTVTAGVGLDDADTLVARFSPPMSLGLELIAVNANGRSVAIIDFVTGTVHQYGPDDYTGPPDAIDGASGGGGFIHLWSNGTIYSYPGSIEAEPLVFEPEPLRTQPGIASTLEVVPAPDGERTWLVQPAVAADDATLVELVNLVEVEVARLVSSEIAGSWHPAGSTTEGLVLISDDPDPQTALVDWGGALIEQIPGRALSVGWSGAAVLAADGTLTVTDAALGNPVQIDKPGPGGWVGAGAPVVPSTAPPLVTGSSQHLLVLAADPEQGSVGAGDLAIVDQSGNATILHDLATGSHAATITRDDGWVAIIEDGDVTLIEIASGESHALGALVPDEHWVFTAG